MAVEECCNACMPRLQVDCNATRVEQLGEGQVLCANVSSNIMCVILCMSSWNIHQQIDEPGNHLLHLLGASSGLSTGMWLLCCHLHFD